MSKDYLFKLEIYDKPEGKKVGDFLAMNVNQEGASLITIPLENENHRNKEGLHIKTDNQKQHFIKDLLQDDMYKQIQSSVFDKEGNSTFTIHSQNMNMSIDDFVRQFAKETMEINKAENPSLSKEQVNTLENLHFWRRNQLVAKRENDDLEVGKSDAAIRELFDRADEQGIPMKLQNNIMDHAENNRDEYFSDLPFIKENNSIVPHHTIKLTSFEPNSLIDAEGLAQLTVTNGVTGKEHSFTVWAENAEEREFEPYHVYMNNPILNDYDSNYETIEDLLNQSLSDTTLFDVVQYDEKVEKAIERYYETGENFSVDFPPEKQISNLHSIIVDEEIADLMIKGDKGLLEKDDIVSFGKLVQNDTDLFDSNIEFIGNQFKDVLEKKPLNKDEMKFADKTFEALNLNMKANDFSLSNEKQKSSSLLAKDEGISR
ncbi:MAG: hypothetical protein ACI35O_16425 [Bacillaceae bacterium]